MAGCAWSMLMVALVAGMLTLALHRGRAGIFELFGVGILLGYYWEGWAIYFGLFAYPFTTVLPPHTGPMWGVIAVMAVCIYEVFLPTPTRR